MATAQSGSCPSPQRCAATARFSFSAVQPIAIDSWSLARLAARCMQADRSGRGGEFAEAYAQSELYGQNAALISSENEEAAIRNSLTTQRALAVTQSTVTPFWWGLWVLLKVRVNPQPILMRVTARRQSPDGGASGDAYNRHCL